MGHGPNGFFITLARYYRAFLHRWGRFLESGDDLDCWLYGCARDRGLQPTCDCAKRALERSLEDQFGPALIADADYIAELSAESPNLNPDWSPLVYRAVQVYRDEVGKYQYLKNRPKGKRNA